MLSPPLKKALGNWKRRGWVGFVSVEGVSGTMWLQYLE